MNSRTEHFDCLCDSFDHFVRFVHDPDDNLIYAEIHLNDYLPWYKRIWVAFRYVFRFPVKETDYDVWIMVPKDTKRLAAMLNEVEELQFDKKIEKTADQIKNISVSGNSTRSL